MDLYVKHQGFWSGWYYSNPFFDVCAEGGTRTHTPLSGTTFWVWRVYQFHHFDNIRMNPFITNTADICLFCLASIVRLFRSSFNDDTIISPPEKSEPSSLSNIPTVQYVKELMELSFRFQRYYFFFKLWDIFDFFFVPQTGLEPVNLRLRRALL